jgi:metastasis-associated protein MTA
MINHLSFPQFHAMDTLHKHSYSIETAMCSLVPSSGPVLCRDEMEEWSASEANLFEEALDKYGKDFNDIRNDFVSDEGIIEYLSTSNAVESLIF